MKALVLGGSVFVGKHLVERLHSDGHDVTVLNRGLTPSKLPSRVNRLVADRTDASSMRAALGTSQWDAVFDVSGFVMAAGGGDVDALLDLFDGRVARYVYVSSIMAYDQALLGTVPWTEDMPANPQGTETYGGFKASIEAALLARWATKGFPAVIVRPAAIYGPDNNIYDMETPMWLRLLQQRPVFVPHSGLVTASYGHVDDLCRCLLQLAWSPGCVGEIFNVSAEAVTTRRYVEILAGIVGVEAKMVLLSDGDLAGLSAPPFGHLFSQAHHAVLSSDKVQRVLGFEPTFDFRTGHADTYDWFRLQGWDRLDEPIRDPLWKSTWDFAWESEVASRLGVPLERER